MCIASTHYSMLSSTPGFLFFLLYIATVHLFLAQYGLLKHKLVFFLGGNTPTPIVYCAASELCIDLKFIHILSIVLLTVAKRKTKKNQKQVQKSHSQVKTFRLCSKNNLHEVFYDAVT